MVPSRAGAVGLAALGGVLLSLAFPPVGFGPYAAAGVALLAVSQYRVTVWRGLITGFVGGAVFFATLLLWLRVIGTDAWIALAAFCAFWFALMGAATALVSRLPGWPVWVASLWVLQESLRGAVPFGGFPWGRLAFAQPDASFGRAASLLGQHGVSFLVALTGCAVVAGVISVRARRRFAAGWFIVAAVCTVGPLVLPAATTSSTTMSVAFVQGGTPQLGMGAMDVRRKVLDNHVRQTHLLADQVSRGAQPQPDLVVWPENSTDIDPFVDASAAGSISGAARAIKAPILVGAVVNVPGNPQGVWNLGVLWDPETGPGPRYVKRHPVPFGEYIPLRSLIAPLIGRLDRIPRDFIAGDRPGVFTVDGVPFGDVICFEVAYDDVMHPVFSGPSQFITVQTNNATYGGTAQPDQQLGIERMRAIEGGRAVIVAATTGVSAFIDADGRVVQHMDQGEVGSRVVSVPLSSQPTVSTAMGDIPATVVSIIAFVAIVLGAVRAYRERPERQPKVVA